jgi:hypothetical protein
VLLALKRNTFLEWILTLKERMKKGETKPRKRERKP